MPGSPENKIPLDLNFFSDYSGGGEWPGYWLIFFAWNIGYHINDFVFSDRRPFSRSGIPNQNCLRRKAEQLLARLRFGIGNDRFHAPAFRSQRNQSWQLHIYPVFRCQKNRWWHWEIIGIGLIHFPNSAAVPLSGISGIKIFPHGGNGITLSRKSPSPGRQCCCLKVGGVSDLQASAGAVGQFEILKLFRKISAKP